MNAGTNLQGCQMISAEWRSLGNASCGSLPCDVTSRWHGYQLWQLASMSLFLEINEIHTYLDSRRWCHIRTNLEDKKWKLLADFNKSRGNFFSFIFILHAMLEGATVIVCDYLLSFSLSLLSHMALLLKKTIMSHSNDNRRLWIFKLASY